MSEYSNSKGYKRNPNICSVQEIDEFWNDCLFGDVNKNNNKDNGPCNSVDQLLTFSGNNNLNPNQKNIRFSSKSLPPESTEKENLKMAYLIQKFNNAHPPSSEEINRIKKDEIKKKKASERCALLYEKALIKKEVSKIIFEKNEQMKLKKEMQECTWQPSLNKTNQKLEYNLKLIKQENKIYNRGIQWMNKHEQKVAKNKKELANEMDDCTFKPQVNSDRNLNYIFDNDKTVFNNNSNKTFIFRLVKARVDEEDKKKRRDRDLSHVLKDRWNRSSLSQSSSLKNLTLRQTLHDELHSIKLDSEEHKESNS